MRLNRKWLYLGGLVTILTLLLTLTWALPAGAVGQLADGSLSADKEYVSPDLVLVPDPATAPHPRAVKVTLSNADLDSNKSVKDDGDFGQVVLAVPTTGVNVPVRVVDHPTFSVNISTAAATDSVVTLSIEDDPDVPAPADITAEPPTTRSRGRKLSLPDCPSLVTSRLTQTLPIRMSPTRSLHCL